MEKIAKDYWDVELHDDCESEYGGISYIGETLGEFIEELDLSEIGRYTPMYKINRLLCGCGIAKINC